jgi:hypothetical protein
VNANKAHLPADDTVTKETNRMSALREFLIRASYSLGFNAVSGGDSYVKSAGTACAGPSSGGTQEARMAAPFGRPRTLRCAVSAAAVLVLFAVGASSAGAASPWWHLTSGSRPTYLNADGGKPGANAVFELTVTGSGGEYFVEEPVAVSKNPRGGVQAPAEHPNPGEPEYEEANFVAIPDEAGAPEIQAKIEEIVAFGLGNVKVTETGAGLFTIEIVERNVSLAAEAGASAALVTLGADASADGELVVTAENLGDATIDGATSPVQITDTLPPGLKAVGIVATQPLAGSIAHDDPIPCELATLTCKMSKALYPYDQIEVRIAVDVRTGAQAAQSGEVNSATVTGGPAKAALISRPITVSSAPVPFGAEAYELESELEGGAPATQAASHPFQSTTTIALNQLANSGPFQAETPLGPSRPIAPPAGLAKDLSFNWPAGLIGNPNPFPVCSAAQFNSQPEGLENVNGCPAATAVGVAVVTVTSPNVIFTGTFTQPVFNLEPHPGEPARFGFLVAQAEAPGFIDTAVRSDGDYGITVSSFNITQIAGLISAKVTVWGAPGDPRHDNSRGWGCLAATRGVELAGPCTASEESHPPAFLSLPTACSGPLTSTVLGDSWNAPFASGQLPILASDQMPGLEGCNRVPFSPTITAEPTSNAATSPTGLNFDLNFDDEGLENSEGLTQSEVKRVVVALPEGFTANPSLAEGLHACTLGQYHEENLEDEAGCPENSKVGEVEIESPLVKQKVLGSLYVAKQGENPNPTPKNPNGNLLTIYLVAKNPELGILITQALRVTPNPVTGQLVTEVDNVPQLPFSKFHLSFRQGQRSPLITPPACGNYTVGADLYPYSDPTVALHDESSFKITQGPEGLGCPSGGVPPFRPGLEAGTINNAAGTYSPFYVHITRKDSEQEITRFSIKLPTGVTAKLAGVSECSDVGIAAAKAREHEGGAAEEEAHPSCPSSSEVGHSTVGAGVGNVLAYAGGRMYLAGPYHGSPISLVSINDAKVGPFDLGTVVVRFAIDVNPETAEVSIDGAGSDPIPHIVDGIPIHLRDIRAYVDRSLFTLNPTSCAKKSTASTILGSGLNFSSSSDDNPVTVSSPFQAADCASLGFKPKLALTLTGKKTHRGALPAFKAVLTYPKYGAYANVAKAQITLPESEYLEQGHLKDVCTRKVFETGKVPGENCPARSIYGHAKATTPLLDKPIEGPVYLRTGYGTKLPELAAALNGPQINITLAGKIDSVHKKGTEGSRIRNTFAVVPDAPVTKFTLEMKGGKKGLLVNSTDVCKGTHKALAAFTGQNGKLDEYEPALKAQCGKKGKNKSAGKKSHKAKK